MSDFPLQNRYFRYKTLGFGVCTVDPVRIHELTVFEDLCCNHKSGLYSADKRSLNSQPFAVCSHFSAAVGWFQVCAMVPRNTISVFGVVTQAFTVLATSSRGTGFRTAAILVDSPRRLHSARSRPDSHTRLTQPSIKYAVTTRAAEHFCTSSSSRADMDKNSGQNGNGAWIGSAGAGGIDLRSKCCGLAHSMTFPPMLVVN